MASLAGGALNALVVQLRTEDGGNHTATAFTIAGLHVTAANSSALIVLAILIVISLVRVLVANRRFRALPESSIVILVGMAVGLIAWGAGTSLTLFEFDPESFFLFLIPPIIFESGYYMQKDFFFRNVGTILLYAVLGTLLNTVMIGVTLWGLATVGAFSSHFSIFEMLMFGSLISAVDPVAVLAIFEEIHVDETLNSLVFGESIVNDAVSIVLFKTFDAVRALSNDSDVVSIPFLVIAKFIVVGFGGLAVGVVIGLLAAAFTRFTSRVPVVEVVLVLLMAYLSYLVAEIFELSGIMAILFCGMVMSRYVENNVNPKIHITLKHMLKTIASTTETLVFVFLGVSSSFLFATATTANWDWLLVIATVISIIVFRFLFTFMLTAIANTKRNVPIDLPNQVVLAYSGLRGAIAFALAYVIPTTITGQEYLVTTTLAVVLFTVFILARPPPRRSERPRSLSRPAQGSTVKPILKRFKIRNAAGDLTIAKRVLPSVVDYIHDAVNALAGASHSGWKQHWSRFDACLQRGLTRKLSPAEEELVRIQRELRSVARTGKTSDHDRHELEKLLPVLMNNPTVNLRRVALASTNGDSVGIKRTRSGTFRSTYAAWVPLANLLRARPGQPSPSSASVPLAPPLANDARLRSSSMTLQRTSSESLSTFHRTPSSAQLMSATAGRTRSDSVDMRTRSFSTSNLLHHFEAAQMSRPQLRGSRLQVASSVHQEHALLMQMGWHSRAAIRKARRPASVHVDLDAGDDAAGGNPDALLDDDIDLPMDDPSALGPHRSDSTSDIVLALPPSSSAGALDASQIPPVDFSAFGDDDGANADGADDADGSSYRGRTSVDGAAPQSGRVSFALPRAPRRQVRTPTEPSARAPSSSRSPASAPAAAVTTSPPLLPPPRGSDDFDVRSSVLEANLPEAYNGQRNEMLSSLSQPDFSYLTPAPGSSTSFGSASAGLSPSNPFVAGDARSRSRSIEFTGVYGVDDDADELHGDERLRHLAAVTNGATADDVTISIDLPPPHQQQQQQQQQQPRPSSTARSTPSRTSRSPAAPHSPSTPHRTDASFNLSDDDDDDDDDAAAAVAADDADAGGGDDDGDAHA